MWWLVSCDTNLTMIKENVKCIGEIMEIWRISGPEVKIISSKADLNDA